SDVRAADASVDLPARVDRDGGELLLLGSEETDAAGVEGQQSLLVQAQTEFEDVGALQEEGPLLGERDRESGEIDLANVHLGLREVGIHGQGRQEMRDEQRAGVR